MWQYFWKTSVKLLGIDSRIWFLLISRCLSLCLTFQYGWICLVSVYRGVSEYWSVHLSTWSDSTLGVWRRHYSSEFIKLGLWGTTVVISKVRVIEDKISIYPCRDNIIYRSPQLIVLNSGYCTIQDSTCKLRAVSCNVSTICIYYKIEKVMV